MSSGVGNGQSGIMARHAALLTKTRNAQLRAVLKLHAPVFIPTEQPEVVCFGCDPGDYAESFPAFPCTTYKLIAGE